MNKNLRKAVMKRSQLSNNFLKNKSKKTKRAYQTQWNYCINLLIRKNFKSFFEDLLKNLEIINLIEDQKALLNDKDIANTFDIFLWYAVKWSKTYAILKDFW